MISFPASSCAEERRCGECARSQICRSGVEMRRYCLSAKAKANGKGAAKKDVKISVAYKPEPPEDGQEPEPVTHASLYVQIVGSKLSAWRFYLEGHQE